jgi:hypothetical protein
MSTFEDQLLESIGIDGQICSLKQSLSQISDGLFNIYFNWRRSYDKVNLSEVDNIPQCIVQIALCKVKTLLSMCDGISVIPNNNTSRILDIPSMISVLRSLYELLFVFHNIYAEQDSTIERQIVLYLWEIKGLNNRQNLPLTPSQYQSKKDNEKQQIENIKSKIIALASDLKLSDQLMGQLKGTINSSSPEIKGYRFKKDDSSAIIAFEDVRFNEGIKSILGEPNLPLYRFLSIQAHPSYLGVLQFGQMYNNGEDKKYLITILTIASKLATIVITVFRDNVKGGKEAFDTISEENRNIIKIIFEG